MEATDLYLRAQALATDDLSEPDCRRLDELLARLRLVLPKGKRASLQPTAASTWPPPLWKTTSPAPADHCPAPRTVSQRRQPQHHERKSRVFVNGVLFIIHMKLKSKRW